MAHRAWMNDLCFLSFPQCTTFDLLEKGIEVHIVADAVSSRRYLCVLCLFVFLFCYLALLSPALNINWFLCVWKLYTCVCVLLLFCVSLHSQTDRLFALSRLKQSGAYLTTTEAVLLQLVQDAKHPNFKEVLTTAALCTRLLSYFVYVCFRCVINISLVVHLKEK